MAGAKRKKKAVSGWGGRREGAGRPPKRANAGVAHTRRPKLTARHPLHIMLRIRDDVWNLKTRRCLPTIEEVFSAGGEGSGFHVVQYSVQPDHLHVLAEASDQRALSRGMQGIGVRLSRAINRLMQREGTIFVDRYDAQSLRTAEEVASVRRALTGQTCPPNQSQYCAVRA
jgi:hypothetical protein